MTSPYEFVNISFGADLSANIWNAEVSELMNADTVGIRQTKQSKALRLPVVN